MKGIVIMGSPGSGKSTIAKKVCSLINAQYISTGEIARSRFAEFIKDGSMAPEQDMRLAVYNELSNAINDGKLFILDGFPRFHDQYEWLKTRFPELLYIDIMCPMLRCIERLHKRKREDDTTDVIIKRMEYFSRYTEPMTMNIVDCISVHNDGAYTIPQISNIVVNIIHERMRDNALR